MRTNRLRSIIATLTLGTAAIYAGAGCSSSDSDQQAPTDTQDAGQDVTTPQQDSSTADSSQDSSVQDSGQDGTTAEGGEAGQDAATTTPKPGDVGSACFVDEDCNNGAVCWSADKEGFPGGYCVIEGCSKGTCPAGSDCFKFKDDISRCVDTCESDVDCRVSEGYACDDHKTCWIAPGKVPPGGSCGADEQCMGGNNAVCVQQAGFPGGYCVIAKCTDDKSCPAGSACRDVFKNGGKGCIGLCGANDACRDGFKCVHKADSAWNDACYPGCENDPECPGDYGCREKVCVDVSHECSAKNPTGDCAAGTVCDKGSCTAFQCHDTVMEPNETQATAVAMPSSSTQNLQICAGDNDWFTVTPLQQDKLFMFAVDSNHMSGNLVFDRVEADGSVWTNAELVAKDYHEENPVGPTNIEAHAMIADTSQVQTWFHVHGENGTTANNYNLLVRSVPYTDNPKCTNLYTPDDCASTTSTGKHDPTKLLLFPESGPGDPHLAGAFLFNNGLHAFGGPEFEPTSRLWARREVIMAIRWAVFSVLEVYPDTKPLGVGDIGMPDGTTPQGHPNGTHYEGANIDIAYYLKPQYIKPGLGQFAYRQICCDAPLNDWHCVDTNTSSSGYGTCIAGSEKTHIVDTDRTALFLAKIGGTGRLRVVGVEAKIEADLKASFNKLVSEGKITAEERDKTLPHIATANSHSSWIWHFNHMHISFTQARPTATTSLKTKTATFQGPWLHLSAAEQDKRAKAYWISHTKK